MTPARPRILLVDDDPGLLRLLSIRLSAAGYEVDAVESGEKALAHLSVARPRLVITDLRMDGLDGMALLDAIHERHPTLPVIILTAHGTIPDAVSATKRGVSSFLTKPFDSRALLQHVDQALKQTGTADEEGRGQEDWRQGIVYRSAGMEDLLSEARLVADTDASVFIHGESGTGKELIARAIHRSSSRAKGPFVAVNCGAIPEPLLESELFGHSKGSFTGATRDHRGLFQAADRGTLFLDEIGDMPLAFQAKLLRVLQDMQVRPLGATEAVPVDVRVISATHRNLEEEMAAGRFREDLYYRLNVVTLEVPSLSERREDIPLLAQHFLGLLAQRSGKKIKGLSPEAVDVLVRAPWPGNVRQLYNVMEQAVALSTTPIIPAALVHKAIREKPLEIPPLVEARNNFEREYLIKLLQTTNGNVSQAARLARRNRTDFYKLLHRHHLDPGLFKPAK
jgi:two-component system, NtrC family, response regulator GlrR